MDEVLERQTPWEGPCARRNCVVHPARVNLVYEYTQRSATSGRLHTYGIRAALSRSTYGCLLPPRGHLKGITQTIHSPFIDEVVSCICAALGLPQIEV